MFFDRHGQFHTGSIGLFDDPDDLAAAEARQNYRHRKEERQIEKALRKWEERGQRAAEKAYAKQLEKEQCVSWFSRHLRFGRKNKVEVTKSEDWISPAVPLWLSNAQKREQMRESKEFQARGKRADMEMFDVQDVEDFDSPFYKELGLVLIKGDTVLDHRVVHKSQVRPPLNESGEKRE
jgi:hypothetical protein